MIKYYIDEIIRRLRLSTFNKNSIHILNTPPVVFAKTGPLILSMVQHRDVLPYLVALKSLNRYIQISGVVIVADKTIDERDCDIFRQQIPGVVIRQALEFAREYCPIGGTWERLIAISNYIDNNYVIQLDADTLTISEPARVIELIKSNISFTLGTYDLQAKVSVSEVARWAQSHCEAQKKPFIQLICESKLLVAADGDQSMVYIRGCSGFAGFGIGSFTEHDIEVISSRMSSVLGESWSRWGTEQFASNYIISNITESVVLPHPVYTTPNYINKTTVFVHFIGPLRYSGGKYLRYLREFLKINKF